MGPVLDMVAGTHCGRRRLQNEDCVAAYADLGLAVLADGMGGHNAGEVASRMAVEVITSGIEAASRTRSFGCLDSIAAEALVSQNIVQANARIFEAAHARAEYAGMGTTVVVALWHDGSLTVGHIGDSRLYRLRERELKQLTRDHSLAQEHIERGMLSRDEARTAAVRNILTRTVGNSSEVSAELSTFEVGPGDLYLVCSDGLTDMLSDEHICSVLLSAGAHMQHAVDMLIDQANELGGADNVSVILVRIASPERGLRQ